MAEPLANTWDSRDLPVLREAVRLADENEHRPPSADTIEANLEMTPEDVQHALDALASAGLIDTVGSFDRIHMDVIRISGDARRLAGAWPTPEAGLDRMLAALEAIANDTSTDEDTRHRARRILDALSGAGRHLGIGVATAIITGQIPGH